MIKLNVLCACLVIGSSILQAPALAADSQREIAEKLTAEQCLLVGRRYQQEGHSENSRFFIQNAIKKDRAGPVGKRAQLFLEANLPKYIVPDAAEADNVSAFNLLAQQKQDAAISLFEDTIASYPRFEWPFHNLGIIYLQKKNTRLAKAYESKALAINPKYAGAWAGMANAYILERNYQAAKECATKALQYDPDNSGASQMLAFLKRRTAFSR